MTDKDFCKIYSSYYGEEIDKVGQLTYSSFNGEELKDFIEHAIEMNKDLEREMKEDIFKDQEPNKVLKKAAEKYKEKYKEETDSAYGQWMKRMNKEND